MLEIAKSKFYKRTQKFMPNFMVIASNILPVLTFIPGWNAASTSNINGPYKAGTLNGTPVYVSPIMPDGQYVLGLNGSDMQSVCGVYAPYMP